ncbi:hypothetical protein PHAVU_005G060800, partial [Phaseolus vulgaris]
TSYLQNPSNVFSGIFSSPKRAIKIEDMVHDGLYLWLDFIYMFALIFVVFDVETVFLYPWAMSFDVLGVSIILKAFL